MNKNVNHLITLEDYSTEEILSIVKLGSKIYNSPQNYSEKCRGKILATLFYEPSTRTKFSFESAMYRLGGNVIGFSNSNTSSASKGESIADTIRVISNYADIAAMRHPQAGTPKLASEYSSIPVINAGDGGHLHPTQTLTDLLTIYTYKGHLEGHTIGLCGDLKYGRTIHSLIKTISKFKAKKFFLISPSNLNLPEDIKDFIERNYSIEIVETSSLEEVIDELDILYMTRIQRERFSHNEDYAKLKDSYILNKQSIINAKKDMFIMHPLPRVNEISTDLDNDPRAVYFNQAELGMYVRMALILFLLNNEDGIDKILK